MEKKTFIEWLHLTQQPMVIDHELTHQGVISQAPNLKEMIVYFRKGGHLFAVKIDKNKFGS